MRALLVSHEISYDTVLVAFTHVSTGQDVRLTFDRFCLFRLGTLSVSPSVPKGAEFDFIKARHEHLYKCLCVFCVSLPLQSFTKLKLSMQQAPSLYYDNCNLLNRFFGCHI